jgi:precorrin-4/cobalt-precorrin-4 C11-methyltransferase
MPPGETLADLARHRAAMAVYLSAGDPEGVADALILGGYPADTPVAVAHRLGWPGEILLWATVASLAETTRQAGATRQTIFLVLPGLGRPGDSRLYDPSFAHGFRPARNEA